jgi:hypothetical protein
MPSVDSGLNGEVAPIINPQLGNHVEKDVAPWKRKENWSATIFLATYATKKGQKVTIQGVKPKIVTP